MNSSAMEIDAPQTEIIDNNSTTAPITTTNKFLVPPSKSANASVYMDTSTIEFGYQPPKQYQQRMKNMSLTVA